MVNLAHLALTTEVKIPDNLPVLPVRDVVVFPNHILPLFVGRPMSIKAVEYALRTDKIVFLIAQRDLNIENPAVQDLYSIGTVGIILRMIRLQGKDHRMKMLVQGLCKARIVSFIQNEPFYIANMEMKAAGKSKIGVRETGQMIVEIKGKLDQLIFDYGKVFPIDILAVIENLTDPEKLAHLIAANLGVEPFRAQEVLEIEDPTQKLIQVSEILDKQIVSLRNNKS
jgi:ATP-dependent Lon protease